MNPKLAGLPGLPGFTGLPPGPRGPHQGYVWSYRVYRDPFSAYIGARSLYGDPFTLPTLRGQVVVSGDPAIIGAIFAGNPAHYEVWAADAFVPVLGKSSLIVESGQPHARLRKLLAPPFHGANIQAYAGVIADIVHREAARWQRGTDVLMHPSMQTISLEVTLRAVFSIEDDAQVERFRAAVVHMLVAAHPALLFFDVAFQGDAFNEVRRRVGPWARARESVETVDALIYEQIRARRASLDKAEGSEGPGDILGMMMASRYDDGQGMTDAELRDQLISLLIAGHETTASALGWALHRIHLHPAIRAKALDEIDALGPDPRPETYTGLTYLDAVCSETLRVHPVVTEASRRLRAPMDLGGYTIPEGVSVAASMALLHSDPKLYPEPEQFRPERFLERKFAKNEFIPFGGGVRRCIGAAFAMYEMKIVLGTILRHYLLTDRAQVPVATVRRGGVTMGPAGGVPLFYEGPRVLHSKTNTTANTMIDDTKGWEPVSASRNPVSKDRPVRRRGLNVSGMARLVFKGDTSALFEFVGDDVVPFQDENFEDPDKPLWLNLGYWTRASTYPEACAALAVHLGEAAGLEPGDRVLDLGFGFGEQHYVWLERFSPARIVGINVTPLQVEVASRRARERGLEDRLDLRVGSATSLPFPDGSFDKVLALESAFHFRTRDAFLKEAFRVLRPGGRLAVIDMLPSPNFDWKGARRKVMRRLSGFIDENMYDRHEYVRRLEALGFQSPRSLSIREDVYPGFRRYLEERRRGRSMRDIVVHVTEHDKARFDEQVRWWSDNLGVDDYVLITADHPHSRPLSAASGAAVG